MADERRKGPPERRRSGKVTQAGEQNPTSATGTPDTQAAEEQRKRNANEADAIDADELDASIRARQQEDRGEVF